jgi:hypothetical protein
MGARLISIYFHLFLIRNTPCPFQKCQNGVREADGDGLAQVFLKDREIKSTLALHVNKGFVRANPLAPLL